MNQKQFFRLVTLYGKLCAVREILTTEAVLSRDTDFGKRLAEIDNAVMLLAGMVSVELTKGRE